MSTSGAGPATGPDGGGGSRDSSTSSVNATASSTRSPAVAADFASRSPKPSVQEAASTTTGREPALAAASTGATRSRMVA